MTNAEAMVVFSYLSLLSEGRQARIWNESTGAKVAKGPIFGPGQTSHIFREARLYIGSEAEIDRMLDVFDAECSAWNAEGQGTMNGAERRARMVAIARAALDDGRDADPVGPGGDR